MNLCMILNYPSQFTELMDKIRGNTEVGIQADDLEEFIATWRKANPVTSAVVAAADGKEAEQVNNPEAADDKEADTTTAKVAKLAQLTVIDLASDVAVFQEHVETVPAHYFFAHTHATYTQAAVTQRHTETHRDTHTQLNDVEAGITPVKVVPAKPQERKQVRFGDLKYHREFTQDDEDDL
jgi:hypothetical protein